MAIVYGTIKCYNMCVFQPEAYNQEERCTINKSSTNSGYTCHNEFVVINLQAVGEACRDSIVSGARTPDLRKRG